MANYDYLDQSIVATCLIEPKDIDSFYNPTTQNHTGYAWDGSYYVAGVQQAGPVFASWYTEGTNAYRGMLLTFPQSGLVLLSKAACTILDSSTLDLKLWMQFLMENTYALVQDFNAALNGWHPSGLAYADGVLSIVYSPDTGNQVGAYGSSYSLTSNLIVNMDFAQDKVYLDVAVNPNAAGVIVTPPAYTMTQHQSYPDSNGSSFNGTQANPVRLFGFASSTDAFNNWTVSQTDNKLYITFYDGAMVQLSSVALNTLSFSNTVTPPSGTAYYTINTVDAQVNGIYQVTFQRNQGVVQYATSATSGNWFTTSFSASVATTGPSTENVFPLGTANPGDKVTVTGSPSSHMNLIFYDSAYGTISSTALTTSGVTTAPAGTAFWAVLLQGASVSGTYTGNYTFS
jgi:hypothetical protein